MSTGIAFPPGRDGQPSTTATGREILAASAAPVPALAETIRAVTDWRRNYVAVYGAYTAAMAHEGFSAASAGAGLAAVNRHLLLDGKPLGEAEWFPHASYGTAPHSGRSVPVTELRVPYRGATLSGEALLDQLHAWGEAKVLEPGFIEAIADLVANPDWLKVEGRDVVLVGAAAEMSPLIPLTEWGASVLAIDLPIESVQGRIMTAARCGAGRVKVPIGRSGVPGLNIVEDPAALHEWIYGNTHPGAVFGFYGYADGGQHVLVSAAADMVASRMLAADPDIVLAGLATPTDAYLVPDHMIDHGRAQFESGHPTRRAQRAISHLTGARVFGPSFPNEEVDSTGRRWGVADSLLSMQGPNYALAKRMQRWRALDAAAHGHRVSANVAPASWTRSVMNNKVFNIAYSGAHRLGVEIFPADTARYLMAAKLVADIHRSIPACEHPEELFY
ncbi:MAG TPA: hypothetical protein VFA96_08305, partial [Nocardioides sp.]|nr:hypothetical protein [Nocardioides sp.]